LAVLAVFVFSVSSAGEHDLTKLSHDPYTDPAAQHATEVEPVMVAHEDTIVSAFQVGRFFGAGSVVRSMWSTRNCRTAGTGTGRGRAAR
jgi:hypothetical protein